LSLAHIDTKIDLSTRVFMHAISFHLNDQKVTIKDLPPSTTLLRYVRDHQLLTGSKEGCAEGDCGACTVIVLEEAWDGKKAQYRAMNSCLILLPMLHGKYVYTVESLKQKQEYHPVQEAMVQRLGSQCGYCTPGIIMSLFEACYRDDIKEQWQVDDQMCGNLCRCTGYRPIQDSAQAIAGLCPDDRFMTKLKGFTQESSKEAAKENTKDQDNTRDANELAQDLESVTWQFQAEGQHFFTPNSLEKLWKIWEEHPQAMVVAGGTDLSLMITKRFEYPEVLIGLHEIKELHTMYVDNTKHIHCIGAGMALSDIEEMALKDIPSLARMLRFFGARQIKNRGTLGGNLCTASPIGDTPPVLLALDAHLILASAQGQRTVPIKDFFTSYRETLLNKQEILLQVQIPLKAHQNAEIRSYKVSKRQELDISSISACFYLQRNEENIVTTIRLAYGGMAATPARAHHAEQALLGQSWSEIQVEQAMQALDQDFTPLNDHRSSAWYRKTVAKNLLYGFWLEMSQQSDLSLGDRPNATVLSV
jgi:xanthine dehydrogenase small subunit